MRAIVAAALALLVWVSPAQAHTSLVSSSPAAGKRVDRAPSHLRLTFSEPVRLAPGGIVLEGADGVQPTGEARIQEATVVVPVEPLGPGRYSVRWRVLAADGHVVQGSFDFTVGSEAASGESEWAPLADPPHAAELPPRSAERARPAAPWGRWLTLLGLALFTGAAALRQPGVARDPRITAAALIGALLLLAGAAAELMLHAHALTGAWRSTLAADTQRMIFASRWGQLWLVRVLAAAAALYLAIRAREGLSARAMRPVPALLTAGVVAVALAVTSHAATLPLPALFIAADALHRWSAALWVGGLLVLFLLLGRGGDGGARPHEVLRRFSGWASWAIPLAVLTGLVPVLYRFAGSRPDLAEAYPQVLALKLALVGVAVGMGAYHRSRVVGRMAGREVEVGGAARVTLALETLLAVTIMLLAGSLAATPPPA